MSKTVNNALSFIERNSIDVEVRRGPDSVLTGASMDKSAHDGDVAWISDQGFRSDETRLASFSGSLLIVSTSQQEIAFEKVGRRVTVIACLKPKLLFSSLVTWLFPTSLMAEWPLIPLSDSPNAVKFGERVQIAAGIVFGASVRIGDDVIIGPNTCIAHTEIGSNVVVGANCSIGLPGFGYEKDDDGSLVRFPHLGRVIIEDDVCIGSNTCIDRGGLGDTIVRRGAKIDNLVHIAHNVEIGENSLIIANAMIGGSAKIGADAWVAPSASVINQVDVGADTVVGMGAVVIRDVAKGQTVVGNPAKPLNH